jgi:hypothetical protein
MMRINPTPRSLSLVAVFTGCVACAHARPASHGSTIAARESANHFLLPPISRRALISTPEIEAIVGIGGKTAYDVVSQLRPEYVRPLNRRGVGPAVPPVVFINNALAGGPESLSAIPASLIEQIRHVTPSEARSWYGGRYEGGMIMVRLRRY